jgi:diguanylate cyclase (GGDEF)-like protein
MHGLLATSPATPAITPTHWLLGTALAQRRAVKRLLLRIAIYAAVWVLLLLVALWGFASAAAVFLMISYGAVGMALSFALLRAGWAPALAEPRFTFIQVMFAISATVIGYWLLPFIRGGALQVIFVLLAFDMHRVSARQLNIATATAVLALGLVWVELRREEPQQQLLEEALSIVMAALFVPVLAMVGRAVRAIHLRQVRQKVELADALAQLEFLSRSDALTGAVNRRHMMTLLDDEAKRQRRSGRPMAIAMLDIDWFKRVNDSHGHAAGDAVLKEMTRCATAALRQTDVLARWGGEEFLLLMPETTLEQATGVAERVRELVRANDWSALVPGLQVTVSCGVSEHSAAATMAQTLERADAALYRAKQEGRDRVCAD